MSKSKWIDQKGPAAHHLPTIFENEARSSEICRSHRAAEWRTGWGLISLLSISIFVLLPTLASSQTSSSDHLELGMQGQTMPSDLKIPVLPTPYSKGVLLVGHTTIWNRGGNMNMARIDSCAYVSSLPAKGPLVAYGGVRNPPDFSKDGVAVIDVSHPSNPTPVKVLRDKGSIYAVETIDAVAAPDRKVLIAGAYGGGQNPADPEDAAWLDIYDASDCKNPRLMSEIKWPENVHMVTLSPNGRRVYGTVISPFTGKGGLNVLNISDMAHPKFIGKFGVTRPDGATFEFAVHEVSISPDERRIYAGVIASKGGDLNHDITAPPPSAEGLGPNAGGVYILDNSDIVDGLPDPKLRLVGTALHGGWHSPVRANINGIPHLVSAGELGACPGSWPKIVNIADEAHPYIEGEFKLQMNHKENCPTPEGMEIATKGIVGRVGTAASHFNDVDSATGTRLGLFEFTWAGLRIADLHDPKSPVEVAYFKPGDACMSHVQYLPKTGQVWFVCSASGFYVIELKPELRSSLGLPKVSY